MQVNLRKITGSNLANAKGKPKQSTFVVDKVDIDGRLSYFPTIQSASGKRLCWCWSRLRGIGFNSVQLMHVCHLIIVMPYV